MYISTLCTHINISLTAVYNIHMIMAETESPPPPTQSVGVDEKKLKYLHFVQVAAIYVFVLFKAFYEYAKGNSGSFKSCSQRVEAIIKSVIGPVCHRFHDVPYKFLVMVDRKVDKLMTEMDQHMPSQIKEASNQAPAIALDVKRAGAVETATNVAKTVYVVAEEYYSKYEPIAEKYVVVAWSSLNRLPLFPQLAHVLVPTTAYCAKRYNQTVYYFASRGYRVSYYVPLVPIDRIAKIFKTNENGHAASSRNGDGAGVKAR